MALSTQQQMLIEQRLSNDKKSTLVAYLLWFFLGFFGAHRFYMGRPGSAVAQLALALIGLVTAFIGVGLVLLLVWGVWVLVDAFLIPGMIDRDTRDRRMQLSNELALVGGDR